MTLGAVEGFTLSGGGALASAALVAGSTWSSSALHFMSRVPGSTFACAGSASEEAACSASTGSGAPSTASCVPSRRISSIAAAAASVDWPCRSSRTPSAAASQRTSVACSVVALSSASSCAFSSRRNPSGSRALRPFCRCSLASSSRNASAEPGACCAICLSRAACARSTSMTNPVI